MRRLSIDPVIRLSIPYTKKPSFNNLSTKLEPIKPTAPVITIFFNLKMIYYLNIRYCIFHGIFKIHITIPSRFQ